MGKKSKGGTSQPTLSANAVTASTEPLLTGNEVSRRARGQAIVSSLKPHQKGAMRTMFNLIERLNISSHLGWGYHRRRDYYEQFGYSRVLRIEDFIAKYTRQGIARRIVNAPALATWARPPAISVPTDPKEQEFKDAWATLIKQANVYLNMFKADKLAGLGNYSIIVLGFDDGLKMDQQVPKGSELLYMMAYCQLYCDVVKIETDSSNARYGLPTLYRLKPRMAFPGVISNLPSGNLQFPETNVHWSRIIHVAEDALDNGILGTPRLEPVFNRLDDLEKVVGGSAEMFWLAANRGMQVDVDKEMDLDEDDEQELTKEIEEYQHQLRRVIRTRGIKINDLGSTVADPKSASGVILSDISATTGIPQAVLMGAEQGHLASDQDRANWADRIKERRETFIEPCIMLPFIQNMISIGQLPEVNVSKIMFNWENTFQLTPLEQAQTMAQMARAVQNLSKQFNNEPIMTKSEARQIIKLPAELPAGMQEFTSVQENTPQASGTSQGGDGG